MLSLRNWLISSKSLTLWVYSCLQYSVCTCHEVMRPVSWSSCFECWVLNQLSHYPLSLSSRGSLVPLHFMPISVVSSAYLRLLIFLLAVLIPACASSSLVFHTMYSACKLNKQGDSIQPWHSLFSILNHLVVPCPVLTVASWPAYRFLRRHIMLSGIPMSLRTCVCGYIQSKALA